VVDVDLRSVLHSHRVVAASPHEVRMSGRKVSDCQLALTAFVFDGVELYGGSLAMIAVDSAADVPGAVSFDASLALPLLLISCGTPDCRLLRTVTPCAARLLWDPLAQA